MKLGEALSERARLQRRIGELRSRVEANTSVREGEDVAENANALIEQTVQTTQDLKELIVAINLANSRTMIDGSSLTEMLAARDALASLAATYNAAADAAQKRDRNGLWGRGETKITLTVNVADLRSRAEAALSEMRRVDNAIQAANWQTDI